MILQNKSNRYSFDLSIRNLMENYEKTKNLMENYEKN